jgi:hypothetical protein
MINLDADTKKSSPDELHKKRPCLNDNELLDIDLVFRAGLEKMDSGISGKAALN